MTSNPLIFSSTTHGKHIRISDDGMFAWKTLYKRRSPSNSIISDDAATSFNHGITCLNQPFNDSKSSIRLRVWTCCSSYYRSQSSTQSTLSSEGGTSIPRIPTALQPTSTQTDQSLNDIRLLKHELADAWGRSPHWYGTIVIGITNRKLFDENKPVNSAFAATMNDENNIEVKNMSEKETRKECIEKLYDTKYIAMNPEAIRSASQLFIERKKNEILITLNNDMKNKIKISSLTDDYDCVFFDLYGQTSSLEIIPSGLSEPKSESIKGSPLSYGRIMLLGDSESCSKLEDNLLKQSAKNSTSKTFKRKFCKELLIDATAINSTTIGSGTIGPFPKRRPSQFRELESLDDFNMNNNDSIEISYSDNEYVRTIEANIYLCRILIPSISFDETINDAPNILKEKLKTKENKHSKLIPSAPSHFIDSCQLSIVNCSETSPTLFPFSHKAIMNENIYFIIAFNPSKDFHERLDQYSNIIQHFDLLLPTDREWLTDCECYGDYIRKWYNVVREISWEIQSKYPTNNRLNNWKNYYKLKNIRVLLLGIDELCDDISLQQQIENVSKDFFISFKENENLLNKKIPAKTKYTDGNNEQIDNIDLLYHSIKCWSDFQLFEISVRLWLKRFTVFSTLIPLEWSSYVNRIEENIIKNQTIINYSCLRQLLSMNDDNDSVRSQLLFIRIYEHLTKRFILLKRQPTDRKNDELEYLRKFGYHNCYSSFATEQFSKRLKELTLNFPELHTVIHELSASSVDNYKNSIIIIDVCYCIQLSNEFVLGLFKITKKLHFPIKQFQSFDELLQSGSIPEYSSNKNDLNFSFTSITPSTVSSSTSIVGAATTTTIITSTVVTTPIITQTVSPILGNISGTSSIFHKFSNNKNEGTNNDIHLSFDEFQPIDQSLVYKGKSISVNYLISNEKLGNIIDLFCKDSSITGDIFINFLSFNSLLTLRTSYLRQLSSTCEEIKFYFLLPLLSIVRPNNEICTIPLNHHLFICYFNFSQQLHVSIFWQFIFNLTKTLDLFSNLPYIGTNQVIFRIDEEKECTFSYINSEYCSFIQMAIKNYANAIPNQDWKKSKDRSRWEEACCGKEEFRETNSLMICACENILSSIQLKKRNFQVCTSVRCSCEMKCSSHDIRSCEQMSCVHFLPLVPSLFKKEMVCERNKEIVETSFIQKYVDLDILLNVHDANSKLITNSSFQQITSNGVQPFSSEYSNRSTIFGSEITINIPVNNSNFPIWLKDLSRRLDRSDPRLLILPSSSSASLFSRIGENIHSSSTTLESIQTTSILDEFSNTEYDSMLSPIYSPSNQALWMSLATRLGYSVNEILENCQNNEMRPSLYLLKDWILNNGNSILCLMILKQILKQLSRNDLVEHIEELIATFSLSSAVFPIPNVFLSYEHRSRVEAEMIRDRLSKHGFLCWMDTEYVKAGDNLYEVLQSAIDKCQVFIACISHHFLVSKLCTEELCHAASLDKPIIPILVRGHINWPPPGPCALPLTNLAYIDLTTIGGHTGNGVVLDLEEKLQHIVIATAKYINENDKNPNRFKIEKLDQTSTLPITSPKTRTKKLGKCSTKFCSIF
ncbi:hypothetical protein SNEBB_003782 [Seison nebaliae]|nr:hypothetical protein SNEBB_003782 [Seison nebaliae]